MRFCFRIVDPGWFNYSNLRFGRRRKDSPAAAGVLTKKYGSQFPPEVECLYVHFNEFGFYHCFDGTNPVFGAEVKLL